MHQSGLNQRNKTNGITCRDVCQGIGLCNCGEMADQIQSLQSRQLRRDNDDYQGKLEVVKQEMARVNIDILGISELKWTRMGEFNSDDHYIYNFGQESLRRNGIAIIVNKRIWNGGLGGNLQNDKMISVHFQDKSFHITVVQVYASTRKGSMKTYKTF